MKRPKPGVSAVAWKKAFEILQVKADSQGVDDVDRSDVLEARTVNAAELGIELALIGILHILGRNLAISLVPLHARLQLEGPGLLVG